MSEPEGEPIDAEVPEPVVAWEGRVVVRDSDLRVEVTRLYRVVATLRVTGPPEEPPGWYVEVERLDHDALATPRWLSVARLPYLSDGNEVSDEYARVLEAALAASGERIARVREKLKETK
jgi:hypothetical protein